MQSSTFRKLWLVLLACLSLVAAHFGLYQTVAKFIPAPEVWSYLLSVDLLTGIAHWSILAFICSGLIISCIRPTRARAFSLILATILFNLFILLFTGPLVIYGPGHILATAIWVTIALYYIKSSHRVPSNA